MTDEDFEELFRVTMLDGLSRNIAALGKHARELRRVLADLHSAAQSVADDNCNHCADGKCGIHANVQEALAEARRVLGRDGGEG